MSQINLQHGTTTDRGEQEEWKTKDDDEQRLTLCSNNVDLSMF